jgi:hypothetical protein
LWILLGLLRALHGHSRSNIVLFIGCILKVNNLNNFIPTVVVFKISDRPNHKIVIVIAEIAEVDAPTSTRFHTTSSKHSFQSCSTLSLLLLKFGHATQLSLLSLLFLALAPFLFSLLTLALC